MNGYIGEIRLFGGNFAPRNWAFCEGQLLAISQNTALFSILGTTYGGDGRTTFGLPDFRGRTAFSQGTGPGLSNYQLGQRGGAENDTINVQTLANHTHVVSNNFQGKVGVASGSASTNEPTDNVLADSGNTNIYAGASAADENLGGAGISGTLVIGNTGGSQSHNNMQPYIAVYYIICLQGVYPSRS